MAMMLDHKPTKIIAVGKSGMGKTLWTNHWIFASDYRYYFVFDHDGQFAFRHKLKSAYNARALLHQLLTRRFVVFNPSEMFIRPAKALEWFSKWVYKMCELLPGTKLFCMDEIQDVVGVNKIGDFTESVLVSGRNRGLDYIGASLQYNMIHNAIRGQATRTVAFNTTEENAIAGLVSRGFDAEEVKRLRPGEYVLIDHWNLTEERGKIIFPNAGTRR